MRDISILMATVYVIVNGICLLQSFGAWAARVEYKSESVHGDILEHVKEKGLRLYHLIPFLLFAPTFIIVYAGFPVLDYIIKVIVKIFSIRIGIPKHKNTRVRSI